MTKQIEAFNREINELTSKPNIWHRWYHNYDTINIEFGDIHTDGRRDSKLATIVIFPDGHVSKQFVCG